jgi:hypothetical protein
VSDRDLITEARAIDAALAPAPWYGCVNDVMGGRCIQTVPTPWSETEAGKWVADMVFRDEDADRIAAMRNLFPTLVEELEDVRGDRNARLVINLQAAELRVQQLGMVSEQQALALDAARQRIDELERRNPDDEMLVEGSWFHPADLPKILGNFMRCSDEYAREAKDAFIALKEARDWARWFAAERDVARLDRASELVAIAAKQQRDARRIAELGLQYVDALTEIGDKGARIIALKAAIAGLQAELEAKGIPHAEMSDPSLQRLLAIVIAEGWPRGCTGVTALDIDVARAILTDPRVTVTATEEGPKPE